MGDNQMVFDIHRCLYVIAHHAGSPAAGGHRARIGIGQRDLLVRGCQHLGLKRLQMLHLLLQNDELVLQTLGPHRPRQRRLLPVGAVQLMQIPLDALFDLLKSARHLRTGKVPVPRIDRLELGTVDRHTGFRKQIKPAAQRDELGTHLADRLAIILAEVGDGLVIRRQTPGQPHNLNITQGFPFKAPARLNTIEVTVDIELQQNPGLIARPARCLRLDPVKAKITEIKFIDKNINNPNRVVFADIILKAFGKQRNLATINALDKTLHHKTPQLTSQDSSKTRLYNASVFTHSGPISEVST